MLFSAAIFMCPKRSVMPMSSRSTKRVTLKMIAEKAGTSIGTVDRALNNRDGISEERKRVILAVADMLGYTPNKLASALGRKRGLHLGLVYPIEPEGFYQYIDMGIDKAAAELHDYGITIEKIRYQLHDSKLQCQRLEALDLTRYDGLAINSAGGDVEALIDRFTLAGVPIITFNTDATDSKRLFYIGNNSRQAGQMGGELLSVLLRGKGNVTVLGNFACTTPFVERFNGFCEYIQPRFPEMHLYPCSGCFSDPELAAQSLIELLERQPDISGIFCTGYSSTVGAVRALKLLGRQDVCLVGFDVAEDTSAAVRDGWCAALLYQDPYQQGYQAALQLSQYILDGWTPIDLHTYINTHIVIQSNLNDYSVKTLSKL